MNRPVHKRISSRELYEKGGAITHLYRWATPPHSSAKCCCQEKDTGKVSHQTGHKTKRKRGETHPPYTPCTLLKALLFGIDFSQLEAGMPCMDFRHKNYTS